MRAGTGEERGKGIEAAAQAVLVGGVAGMAYARFLGTGFTGRDLPGLVETSKDLDLGQVFTRGLLESGTFFRPLAMLSFHFDYAWFGLNAPGYHATDLVFHILAAVLTFVFVRTALDAEGWAAVLAGAIVAIHPAAAEVVPNISFRMDSMVTAATLLTLCLFAAATRAKGGQRRGLRAVLYAGALGSFVLAMLAKEIGFVTIGILGWYVLVMDDAPGMRARVVKTAVLLVPFAAAAGIVMWWRAHLFGDALGGVEANPFADVGGWGKEQASHFVTYVWFLLFPGAPSPADFGENQFVNFVRANGAGLALVAAVVAGAAVARRRGGAGERPGEQGRTGLSGRKVVFLGGWLLLPFGVFALTLFRYRYIYFAIPPMAILLALAAETVLTSAWEAVCGLRSAAGSRNGKGGALRGALCVTGGLAMVVVLAQLVMLSPLVQGYDGFARNGQVTQALIEEFENNKGAMETAGMITVENLPSPQWEPGGLEPQARELGNLWLPGYYRLATGDTASTWCVRSIVRTTGYPVEFQTKKVLPGEYRIEFEADPNGERVVYADCCQDFFCK